MDTVVSSVMDSRPVHDSTASNGRLDAIYFLSNPYGAVGNNIQSK